MSNAIKKKRYSCDSKINCKPFVKWVGGKTQLVSELIVRAPVEFNQYLEPFVGGGAFFFALQPDRAILSDINSELVNAYKVVKFETDELVNCLSRHNYSSDYYYKIRNLDRTIDFESMTAAERAARLIYLNKTCYNGLYRVNSRGEFNTPFGKYVNPKIVDRGNLHACRMVLKNAEIKNQHFSKVLEQARSGDFVYFDPPYVPVSDTSYFTSYSRDGFGPKDQEQLRDVCIELDRRGVHFMLSNSATDFVKELYAKFTVEIVYASRAINSKANKRGAVEEVIVKNY